MKKAYVSPVVEIDFFEEEDIICTSPEIPVDTSSESNLDEDQDLDDDF